jgi:hypothetical protein
MLREYERDSKIARSPERTAEHKTGKGRKKELAGHIITFRRWLAPTHADCSARRTGVMSSRLHIEPGTGDEGIKRERRESSSFCCHGYGPGSPAGEHDEQCGQRWRCWLAGCWTSAAQTAYNCSPRTKLGSAVTLMRCHKQKSAPRSLWAQRSAHTVCVLFQRWA